MRRRRNYIIFKANGENLKLGKDDIIKHVQEIRKEIGHVDSDIDIKELIYNSERDELWILTPDIPDKSAIIGKGGWVVGILREELNINKIHVESYSNYILKKYRIKLSLKSVKSFLNKENTGTSKNKYIIKPMTNLKSLLEEKMNYLYDFTLDTYFDKQNELFNENDQENINIRHIENKYDNKHNANYKNKEFNINNKYDENNNSRTIVALSGGVDSSFSLILAKNLGFNPAAITIDPGTIVLPKQFKNNINKLCDFLSVKHEYIKVNHSEIIDDSLNGRFHPCGRCSDVIETVLFDYAMKNNINIVIFGDMLSTGSQCITKYDQNLFRLNLPAALSMGKEEIKNTVQKYDLEKIKGFGCPLLSEVHKKYPHLKKFSMQRILRETRSGALEPGEALDLIWSFYRT